MPPRRRATILAAVLAVTAALIGLSVNGPRATSGENTKATPPRTAPTAATAPSGSVPPGSADRLPPEQRGGLSEADGVVPDGVTVFDNGYPAVAKLDPALLAALRRAATVAARQGVTFSVDSGWRSPKYQEQLLDQAIAKYGSAREAARWVARPDTSAHVSGDAVDVGHSAATAWLSRHGAAYGLCQIYRNEPWHYEVRPHAVDHGCPAMYADPTSDPRMQGVDRGPQKRTSDSMPAEPTGAPRAGRPMSSEQRTSQYGQDQADPTKEHT